jgi:hypothetical protein
MNRVPLLFPPLPGQSHEEGSNTCGSGDPVTTGNGQFPASVPQNASGAIVVENSEWTYQGGEVYATVDDQRTADAGKPYFWTTHMRFTLHHDPPAAR